MNACMQDIHHGKVAGFLVHDFAECEEECDKEPSCNAASYYTEAKPGTGKNCYLKHLEDACVLPRDAIKDPKATLSLKCVDGKANATGPGNLAVTPDPVLAPESLATSPEGFADSPDQPPEVAEVPADTIAAVAPTTPSASGVTETPEVVKKEPSSGASDYVAARSIAFFLCALATAAAEVIH
jgi:PAN domain